MQTVQRLLLLLFAAFAALTVLQQIRYGMICGRSEQERTSRMIPRKVKCCQQSTTTDGSRDCLIVNIIIGALSK